MERLAADPVMADMPVCCLAGSRHAKPDGCLLLLRNPCLQVTRLVQAGPLSGAADPQSDIHSALCRPSKRTLVQPLSFDLFGAGSTRRISLFVQKFKAGEVRATPTPPGGGTRPGPASYSSRGFSPALRRLRGDCRGRVRGVQGLGVATWQMALAECPKGTLG